MKGLFLAARLSIGLWLLSAAARAQPAITFVNGGTGWAAPWYVPGRWILGGESSCSTSPVGGTNLVAGTGFTAQLWVGLVAQAMAPVSATVFRPPGILAGQFIPTAATAIPWLPTGQSILYQLRVWDNRNGTITAWYQNFWDFAGRFGQTDVYTSPPLSNGTTTLEFRDSYALDIGYAFHCPVISVGVVGTSSYLSQRSVYEGDNVTLTVECPNPAATVQWSHYGTNLPGETNLSLNVTGVDSGSAGLYTAVVTAIFGSRVATMSNAATVTLLPPPRIVQPRIDPMHGFIARLDGVPARNVQIDVSPDLQSWTSWRTQYFGITAFPQCYRQDSFTNSLPLPPGGLFYRARVLP